MSGDDKMGVHLDGTYDGFSGRLEVIEGPTGRRQRSSGEKARIVAESLVPGVRVADVARKHGVTRWQVYDWRKQLRSGRLALPESVASMPAFAALLVEEPLRQARCGACIEIVAEDIVIRAQPDVDDAHLTRVIRAVRAAR